MNAPFPASPRLVAASQSLRTEQEVRAGRRSKYEPHTRQILINQYGLTITATDDDISAALNRAVKAHASAAAYRPEIHMGDDVMRCPSSTLIETIAFIAECDEDEVSIKSGDNESDDPSIWGDQIYVGGELVGYVI